jgi:ankyrin repeat protein
MGPLHAAVYNVDESAVQLLLAQDLDPNERDDNGFTPLHWAGLRGAVGDMRQIVSFLVTAGADLNLLTSSETDSVLSWAVEAGNLDLVAHIIAAGADPNLRASEVTPLMRAAASGNLHVVDILLRNGADPNARTGSFSAAEYADHYGFAELATNIRRVQHGT